MTDFVKLDQESKIDILMPLILQILQDEGGSATRTEIESKISDYNEDIPLDYIKLEKPAKSGGTFRPFRFPFNFAIKNLDYAGFITSERGKPVVLTDKGMEVDAGQLDIDRDIKAISGPKWEEKRQQNRERKRVNNDQNLTAAEDESSDIEEGLNKKFLSAVKQMNPKKFEYLCRAMLKEMGVEIDKEKGISYVSDGGIDGYGYHIANDFRTTRVAIQAKRWDNGAVSSPEIDKFIGAMDKFRAEYGVFITTSYFTKAAKEAARQGTHTVTLIDGDKFVELAKKYQVGLIPLQTYELDEKYFEE